MYPPWHWLRKVLLLLRLSPGCYSLLSFFAPFVLEISVPFRTALRELLYSGWHFSFSTPRKRGVGVGLQHPQLFKCWTFMQLCKRTLLFGSILWCPVQFLSLLLARLLESFTCRSSKREDGEGRLLSGVHFQASEDAPYAYRLIIRDPDGEGRKTYQCCAVQNFICCTVLAKYLGAGDSVEWLRHKKYPRKLLAAWESKSHPPVLFKNRCALLEQLISVLHTCMTPSLRHISFKS